MLILNKKYKEIFFVISSIFFLITTLIYCLFDQEDSGFQWLLELEIFNTCILLGIDSISLCFMFLITLFIPLCFIFNWNIKRNYDDNKLFFFILLFLELLLILVFLVLDLVAFYVVFEFILIPFYIVIVINKMQHYIRNDKQVNRKMHAFFLLFFYTIFGSLIMLFSIFTIYILTGTTMIPLLWNYTFNYELEYFLWLSFFFSFSIKIPILPVHIWLPEAHVESPTEASVILAAIMLKVGTYGILRILIPIFTNATIYFSIFVWLLCIISVLYTSMSATIQIDIKRIIAYASIGHMNICMLGLMSMDIVSICGSIVLMIAHGLTSGGLFFAIGSLYNRFHTKNIKYFNGIVQFMPLFSSFFFVFIISNFSFPGTINFIGEFLIFTSFFSKDIYFFYVCIFFCVLLSSFYSIILYNKLLYGIPNNNLLYHIMDINVFEFVIYTVLVFLIILFGIYPSPIITLLTNDLNVYFKFFL